MREFFGKRRTKIFDLHALDFDRLALYVLPKFMLEIVRKYLRLEVEGLENIPDKGRALVIPNHSGWSGFDAVMIGNEIHKAKKRIPRILAHSAYFVGELKVLSEKMGMQEASTENGTRLLKKGNVVILFPEGEYGNFKPTSERYHLQEFKRGFVRMAIQTKAPIIPTIVIGAEETHINLGTLKLTKYLKGQIIPLPLNVLPLPAKWKIKFLPPITLSNYTDADLSNSELIHQIADDIRGQMQTAIDHELANREWVYFKPKKTEEISGLEET
ncbi:MAG: lysophospholipid acyltransferase family protein [Bacteriovoracia bacterium]